jgi:type I restriction enzyme S subunit
VALADLCEVNVGRTPSRSDSRYWGQGQPWLSIGDMGQGRRISRTKEQISSLGAAGGRQVKPGTVLLSFKLSIGKVAIAGIPLYTNEAIAALPIKDINRLDPLYLMRALEALDLSGGANRAAMGATLNKRMLAGIEVPVPSLEEQRRIAAILDQADALRARRRQVLTALDALPQAVLKKMFDNPSVETRPLAEWIDANRPITYGILKPGPEVPDGVLYVRVADMKDRAISLSSVRRTSKEIAQEYKRSTLRQGDLLMSIRGHVGRFAVVPKVLDGANITQDSARLAIPDPDQALYVRAVMESESLQHWMNRRTKGAAVTGINLGDLRLAPIPVPPKTAYRQFASTIRAIESQRVLVLKKLVTADQLFKSLQASAFRGEL